MFACANNVLFYCVGPCREGRSPGKHQNRRGLNPRHVAFFDNSLCVSTRLRDNSGYWKIDAALKSFCMFDMASAHALVPLLSTLGCMLAVTWPPAKELLAQVAYLAKCL